MITLRPILTILLIAVVATNAAADKKHVSPLAVVANTKNKGVR